MLSPEIVFAVRESKQVGYEARAVGHSIFTQAETMDELRLNVAEAVRVYFRDGNPRQIRLVKVPPGSRWLGSAKGEFTVPDDFNDPLPKEIEDLFW